MAVDCKQQRMIFILILATYKLSRKCQFSLTIAWVYDKDRAFHSSWEKDSRSNLLLERRGYEKDCKEAIKPGYLYPLLS